MVRIAVIGCGNLGKSVIKSAIQSGFDRHEIRGTVKSIRKNTDKFIYPSSENVNIASKSDSIFLCVKPFQIKDVLLSIKNELKPHQTVISMAAGVPVSFLKLYLPKDQPLIRCMPSLSVECNIGIIGSFSENIGSSCIRVTLSPIFSGSTFLPFETENKIDACTPILGSGPAFISYFVKQMISSGMLFGLSNEESKIILSQTLIGTAKMMRYMTPDEIMSRVASAGGCTEAGLLKMTREGCTDIFRDSLEESFQRLKDISRKIED